MLADAQHLDTQDPLKSIGSAFALPQGVIYLDGNSLGPLPIAARERAVEVTAGQWGTDLITSWNKHRWIDLPTICGEQIAPIIGAGSEQVVCCDSISVNLFKVLSAALAMQSDRHKVITTEDNFPTDIYTVEGLQEQLGTQRCELIKVAETDIERSLDEHTAVLLLTQVNFRSGRLLDMQALTSAAHKKGILVVWDLAHSAGAVPVALDEHGADFAVGCTYKYLNGGPGAPAFIYVAKRHQRRFRQPISGWMGHATPFAFDNSYAPSQSIKQSLSGTPPVLSMSVLNAALALWADIDMTHVRAKSIALSEFFLEALNTLGLTKELTCISPLIAEERGSQLAFRHEHSYAICQAWIDAGVIADFRAPDILRIGFAPLYLSFADLWHACEKLKEVVESRAYLDEKYQRKLAVT
ncbi:kynureninase [Alteromonas gilva]|uniref:Kynureninase n=1 Tax=Alteromonas gilva TaxID=2987522 RepID=A0ABT5L084_9ALTE|nr:kynureninase [Alteromonas gilva]MDC8829854.1 kynureninase [Alteromonas gilva]